MLLKLVSSFSILLLTYVNSQGCDSCTSRVNLTTGEIEGHHTVINGSMVGRSFLGIPYAEPPLGPLRFVQAKPKEKWNGTTLLCHHYKPACWQNRSMRSKPARISEDCLYLNVFVDENCTIAEPCAVVIFIHGGEFDFDSPSIFDPNVIHQNFAMKNLMFLTVAYRLGIFGFFSTGTSEAQGNYGLSDIIEAMKWVKREASAFGGDSSRITLMGHSSGGSAVSLLTLSPKTDGLMKQAIVMSGSALSPHAFLNNVTPYVLLGHRLGCHPLVNAFKHNISAVVECMRAIPADQLDYEYTRLENEIGFFTAPVVDGLDGILPANPLLLVQNRRPMPYLLGTTKSEFIGNELEETEEYATPLSLLLACKKALVTWKIRFGKIRQNVKDCFKEYAFKAITDSNSPGVFNWSAAIRQVKNDNEIFWPVYADASTMRDTGGTVYLYSFDYVKNNSDSTTPHAIDLTYILGLHTFPFDERDKKIQQIILALLINFVKTSNPTPMPVSGVTWIPVAFPNGRNYLSIDDKLQMKPFYYENRLLHRTALSDAFQITGQPGNFRSRKFQNAELNLTGLPSDAAIQMMLKIMYEEMEHDGHSISTNASEARSQWQSFKPWFNGSQQSEVILYWTCIALLVVFLLVGILVVICCSKGKHRRHSMKSSYEPLTGYNDKKLAQSVPTYQTF